ncbi:MAG: hypothetical protein RLZZ491_392, partial [Pseudomonadota bacterium]
GLPIAEAVVTSRGGRLDITPQNAPNAGLTVTVTLPLSEPLSEAPSEQPFDSPPETRATPAAGPRTEGKPRKPSRRTPRPDAAA